MKCTYKDIHQAAKCGDLDRVKKILRTFPELEQSLDSDVEGNLPLIWTAAMYGHLNIVEFLYDRAPGTDPKPILAQRNTMGMDLLSLCIINLKFEVANYIADKGYVTNRPKDGPYMSIWFVIRVFLASGYKSNNDASKNVAENLAKSEHLPKLLLKCADPNELIETGVGFLVTPLIMILINYDSFFDPIIDILLSFDSIDVNRYVKCKSENDEYDITALHLIVHSNLINILSKLSPKKPHATAKASRALFNVLLSELNNFDIELQSIEKENFCNFMLTCAMMDPKVFLACLEACDDITFLKICDLIAFCADTGKHRLLGGGMWSNVEVAINDQKCIDRMLRIIENYSLLCVIYPEYVKSFCAKHNIEDPVTLVTPKIPVRFESRFVDLRPIEYYSKRMHTEYNISQHKRDNLIASLVHTGAFKHRGKLMPIPKLFGDLKKLAIKTGLRGIQAISSLMFLALDRTYAPTIVNIVQDAINLLPPISTTAVAAIGMATTIKTINSTVAPLLFSAPVSDEEPHIDLNQVAAGEVHRENMANDQRRLPGLNV